MHRNHDYGGGGGGNRQTQEKRKLSIVLRDYDNQSLHCNGINSMAVTESQQGQA